MVTPKTFWFLSSVTRRVERCDGTDLAVWEDHLHSLWDQMMCRGPMIAADIGWPESTPRQMIEGDL